MLFAFRGDLLQSQILSRSAVPQHIRSDTAPSRIPPESRRSGLTILETLLAVVVIAVVLSLSVPAISRVQQRHKVRLASVILHGRLSAVRIHAIRFGVPYEFLVEPSGRRYLILPAGNEGAAEDSKSTGAETPAVLSGELPDGIHFAVPPEIAVVRIAPARLAALELPQHWGEGAWARPIRVAGDGSANDAAVSIADKDRRTMRLELRGATGTVRVRAQ
jgi:type II secretory pathway pseudopilin PulG